MNGGRSSSRIVNGVEWSALCRTCGIADSATPIDVANYVRALQDLITASGITSPLITPMDRPPPPPDAPPFDHSTCGPACEQSPRYAPSPRNGATFEQRASTCYLCVNLSGGCNGKGACAPPSQRMPMPPPVLRTFPMDDETKARVERMEQISERGVSATERQANAMEEIAKLFSGAKLYRGNSARKPPRLKKKHRR